MHDTLASAKTFPPLKDAIRYASDRAPAWKEKSGEERERSLDVMSNGKQNSDWVTIAGT